MLFYALHVAELIEFVVQNRLIDYAEAVGGPESKQKVK